MSNYDCRRCGLLSKAESQFCAGCGLYHGFDECVDAYFNDPEAWCACREYSVSTVRFAKTP